MIGTIVLGLLIGNGITIAQADKFVDRMIPEREVTLDQRDFERGRYVVETENDQNAPTYNSQLFEGDIANPGLNAQTVEAFLNPTSTVSDPNGFFRNAINSQYKLWPNRRVPYTISSQYSSYSRSRIASAMDEYAKQTCIQFVPRQGSERNYVSIRPDNGCYSLVGRSGGRQTVSLDSGCVQKGIIMHELMHAVGFFHEQSRTDRDNYIDILYDNIQRGASGQFRKYSTRQITDLGASYDYGSIMHYGPRAFSRNGQPTIRPKRSGVSIGQRRGFSSTDAFKINKLYQCDGPSGVVSTTFAPFTRTTPRPFVTTTRPPTGQCSDERQDCQLLQSLQWCTTERTFMQSACRRTCGFCTNGGGVLPNTPRPVSNCRDTRSSCQQWASYNLCRGTFERYMRQTCAKSCGFC